MKYSIAGVFTVESVQKCGYNELTMRSLLTNAVQGVKVDVNANLPLGLNVVSFVAHTVVSFAEGGDDASRR